MPQGPNLPRDNQPENKSMNLQSIRSANRTHKNNLFQRPERCLTFALFLGQSSAQNLLGGFLPTAKLEELVQEVSWGREGEGGDGERG